MRRNQVEKLIDAIRNTHDTMQDDFMYGCCFELFKILRVVWPQAKPWYVYVEGHIYTEIDGKFYDIRGMHHKIGPMAVPLERGKDFKPHLFHNAFRWHRSFNRDRREVLEYRPELRLVDGAGI